jgi:hypothetical protein
MGERDPAALDAIDDGSTSAFPVRLTRRFIERASGVGLAIPNVRSSAEAALLDRINERFPSLSAADGWKLAFGRELNASDDRRHFAESGRGLPVLEGKQIEPFRVNVEACRHRIAESVAARLLGEAAYKRPRLAYREVAGATNRLTLIAAIVPGDVVTTHSLFCLKTTVRVIEQSFLCGVLNSFVANFLVRLFVTTHVTATVMGRLRAPRLAMDDPLFQEIAGLSDRLSGRYKTVEAGQSRFVEAGLQRGPRRGSRAGVPETRLQWNHNYARLQALVAHAYELDEPAFAHVLSTFPLVDAGTKDEAMRHFQDGIRGSGLGAGGW